MDVLTFQCSNALTYQRLSLKTLINLTFLQNLINVCSKIDFSRFMQVLEEIKDKWINDD